MSDTPDFRGETVDAIVGHAGRATLPFKRADRDEQHATAFWFNDLVETTSEGEFVRQFLVTASEPTKVETAEFTLRHGLCAPAPSSENLLMFDFAEGWTHLDGLGVAVMPTGGLHAHGARKGWHWTTDEITDGIAAGPEDIAGLGPNPVTAYLLGHDVGTGKRPARDQAVVLGEVTRTGDGGIHWTGTVPQGCAGAPVFIDVPLEGNSFKLVCLGVALPGDGHHTIAPFDRIRTALRALGQDTAPVLAVTEPPAQPREPKRHWWQRRG
uniref:Uncharacterized protein n=1 Tax=Streptomyces sp. NBC_01393 TaxID=2903851 RepID=A0AAU3I5I6_9ACTN